MNGSLLYALLGQSIFLLFTFFSATTSPVSSAQQKLSTAVPLPILACDRVADSLQLVALFNATDGPNWLNTWDLTQPMDTWHGIRLNAEGCVRCIDLDGVVNCDYSNNYNYGNRLDGLVPALDLPQLTYLSLMLNQLEGPLPDLSNLPSLVEVVFSNNNFFDTIPNYSNLPDLRRIRFYQNRLYGEIPDFDLPSLEYLGLEYNDLSGEIPDFSSVPKLRLLLLRGNNLEGQLFKFSNLPELVWLYLSDNNLDGPIPNYDIYPKLELLYLDGNQLTGTIPDFFDSTPLLRYLDLGENQLEGTIPDLSNLPDMIRIHLHRNQLSGTIPDWSNLTNLSTIYLNDNQLSGTIPDFSSQSKLYSLHLSNNQFVGQIPDFPSFSNLYTLELSDNQFDGAMPDFSNLTNARYIYLSNNQLEGCLPSLSNMPKLIYLEAENNNLNCISLDYQSTPDLARLYLDENRLTFEDILPDLDSIEALIDSNSSVSSQRYDYAPQQNFYPDTTIVAQTGTLFSIDLVIDDTVSTTTYNWYKDGAFFQQIQGDNELTFNDLTLDDAGAYYCRLTNPHVPGLTLITPYITLIVEDIILADCDDENLLIDQNDIPSDVYRAADSIEASGTVEGVSQVTFVAGQKVRLLPGFQVFQDAQFHSYMEDCNLPAQASQQILPPAAEVALEEQGKELSLSIFPNPGRDITNLAYFLPEATTIDLFITDLNGRKVKVIQNNSFHEAGEQQLQLDLSGFSAGIYHIHLIGSQENFSRKMVVIE